MKKTTSFTLLALLLGIFFTSCTSYKIIPKAVNTVNSVGLRELNLKHGSDYTIMNTTTAEATVYYSEGIGKISIREENNEFEIIYTEDKKTGKWIISTCKGIARFGFLSNDYGSTSLGDQISPEDIVRRLAIYRLINATKVRGADGVIEPVISTNIEQRGRDIVFKTTASAKLIKLSTDSK